MMPDHKPQPEQEHLIITWSVYSVLAKEIARQLDEWADVNKETNLNLFGIRNGGTTAVEIVRRYLKHEAATELLWPEDTRSTDRSFMQAENAIVIDDIADTGATLRPFFSAFKTAALVYKYETCCLRPDFYGGRFDGNPWIVFPYEV